MHKIGVLVSGGGTNLQALIDAQLRGELGGEIKLVVSSSKNAFALERAAKNGISSVCIRKKDHETREAYTLAVISALKEKQIDLVAMAGFNLVLSPDFTEEFRGRIMNIHPSLIPSFCGDGFWGIKVHEAVIRSGVKVTGATVHFVNEETDGGPIILQKAVDVMDDDTPEELQQRVMEQAEWVIYPQAVRMFCEGRLEIERNRVRRIFG